MKKIYLAALMLLPFLSFAQQTEQVDMTSLQVDSVQHPFVSPRPYVRDMLFELVDVSDLDTLTRWMLSAKRIEKVSATFRRVFVTKNCYAEPQLQNRCEQLLIDQTNAKKSTANVLFSNAIMAALYSKDLLSETHANLFVLPLINEDGSSAGAMIIGIRKKGSPEGHEWKAFNIPIGMDPKKLTPLITGTALFFLI